MAHTLKQLFKNTWWVGAGLTFILGSGAIYAYTRTPTLPLRYVLASATRGTVIVSVTGSGQVSGENQLDIKPVVSGSVTKVLVEPGERVTANTPLFEIDRKAAQRTVRDAVQSLQDARLSLDSAQLSLQKLRQPPEAVSLVQAQHSLNQAKRDLEALKAGPDELDIRQAEADLASQLQNIALAKDGKTPRIVRDVYDDTVPILKTTAQTLQQALYNADAIIGVDNITSNDSYEKTLSITDTSKLARAQLSYPAVKESVRLLKQQSDPLLLNDESIENIQQTLRQAELTIALMDPFLQTVYDTVINSVPSPTVTQSTLDGLRSSIQSERSGVASKLSSLTTQRQAIQDAQKSFTTSQLNVDKARTALEKIRRGPEAKDIATAEERVKEAETSLAKLQKGTDPADLAAAENTIAQRRSAVTAAQSRVADAQEALNDYTVRAPFDGVVAKILVRESDQASASTALLTLLTEAKIAQITLNEVDVAKVRVGQKSTLTFDAIPDLSIAGTVSEVDTLGTATQGVVNYAVKITFTTQDERIKSGMSVSASIVTDIHSDVLTVPNGAVQRQGTAAFVQTLSLPSTADGADPQGVTSDTPPEARPVTIGLSNEQQTEIVSGLNEGEYIVTRVIDPNAAAPAARTAAPTGANALRIPGVGGLGGGGAFRAR